MNTLLTVVLPILIAVGGTLALVMFTSMAFRRVVPTNMIHIVQSSKSRKIYGTIKGAEVEVPSEGNTYWEWPRWIPFIGVAVTEVPTSIFDITLKDYEAFDSDKLPFNVDVIAFLRVINPLLVAERVDNTSSLAEQVRAVIQGCVRSTMATDQIENIMGARETLSKVFSEAVSKQLGEWGLVLAKSLEFNDIRDSKDSKLIRNIVDKQRARIESESRIQVAEHNQKASLAEADAAKAVALRKEQVAQETGIRAAERLQAVGMADQESKQAVLQASQETATREVELRRVSELGSAEVNRKVAEVQARQHQEVAAINAETQSKVARVNAEADANVARVSAEADAKVALVAAEAEATSSVAIARGKSEAAALEAQGIEAIGKAKAASEEALLMAPVTAQVELAEKIGSNQQYQEFLIRKEQVAANMQVGLEQARAIAGADLKIIANSSDVSKGLTGLGSIVSTQGGFDLASALTAMSSTEEGADVLGGLVKFLSNPKLVGVAGAPVTPVASASVPAGKATKTVTAQ